MYVWSGGTQARTKGRALSLMKTGKPLASIGREGSNPSRRGLLILIIELISKLFGFIFMVCLWVSWIDDYRCSSSGTL